MLDPTLNALINVAMNGPEELEDDDAWLIAEKWQTAKKRRSVTEKALERVAVSAEENAEEWDDFLTEEVETSKFWL